mgnify:FL=1
MFKAQGFNNLSFNNKDIELNNLTFNNARKLLIINSEITNVNNITIGIKYY